MGLTIQKKISAGGKEENIIGKINRPTNKIL